MYDIIKEKGGDMMHILSVRDEPEYENLCIRFFREHCTSEEWEKSIHSCIYTESALPQWYLLMDNKKILGGVGLVNCKDTPWLCGLYIEEAYCNDENASLLIKKIKKDAAVFGYEKLYVCTNQIAFYERQGFSYINEQPDGFKVYAINCYNNKRLSIRSIRKELMQAIFLLLVFEFAYLICKVDFFNWADFLALNGLIVLLLAIIFKRRFLSVMTIVGYLVGYGLGAISHTTTIDRFGRHDNWWFIWTYTYLLIMLLGLFLDILAKRRKEFNSNNEKETDKL